MIETIVLPVYNKLDLFERNLKQVICAKNYYTNVNKDITCKILVAIDNSEIKDAFEKIAREHGVDIILQRDKHNHLALNLLEAKMFAFDTLKSDFIWLIEDDIFVSKYYFVNIKRVYEAYSEKFDNIGLVNSETFCVCENKRDELYSYVQSCVKIFPPLTNFLQTKKCWDETVEALKAWYARFIPEKYRDRNSQEIRAWFAQNLRISIDNFASPLQPTKEFFDFFTKDNVATGQDAAIIFLAYTNGFCYISTMFNHVICPPNVGEHTSLEWYDTNNYTNITLEEIELERDKIVINS